MSAIAGIFYFKDALTPPALIQTLTASMRRRGPDEQTYWTQGSIALGHCMLRTTPEALEEHQPLTSEDGSLVMVWDGRLDNRDELKRDLSALGVVLRNNSDAELALQSYASWGEACAAKLLGDFAFAVWDAARQQLFCARDHMGARPFYYTKNDQFFAFASEDEALIALPGVSRDPDDDRMAYFLVRDFSGFENANTWLKGVKALQPAQTLTVCKVEGVKTRTYWKLEPRPLDNCASEEACLNAFEAVFAEAVRCRMRSLGDVAAMISGGMDSAGLAVMAKRVLSEIPGKAVHTYSAIADVPDHCAESQRILGLTRPFEQNAHFVSVPSFTGMLDVRDLLEADKTNLHPVNTLLLPAMMCMAASRHGHRVMLHGAGGDITMHTPYRYMAHWLRKGQWRTAWAECQYASRNHTYLQGRSPLRLLLENLGAAYAPRFIKRIIRAMRWVRSPSPLADSMINPAFAQRVGVARRMKKAALAVPLRFSEIQAIHVNTIQATYGLVLGLSEYDRVAGRYGMEARDPWSDKRVAEFWVNLPLEYKVRQGWTKYLARTYFGAMLPKEAVWHSGKEHLGGFFYSRLIQENKGASCLALEQGVEQASHYFDRGSVTVKCQAFCERNDESAGQMVYDIITIKNWLKRISG